jgi:hypothetical protein
MHGVFAGMTTLDSLRLYNPAARQAVARPAGVITRQQQYQGLLCKAVIAWPDAVLEYLFGALDQHSSSYVALPAPFYSSRRSSPRMAICCCVEVLDHRLSPAGGSLRGYWHLQKIRASELQPLYAL